MTGEVVTIANLGSTPQEMTGWVLLSVTGDQSFVFPAYTLAANAVVKVTSGPNGYSDPPRVLQWRKADGTPYVGYIWNNDGDPATLSDLEGNVVAKFP